MLLKSARRARFTALAASFAVVAAPVAAAPLPIAGGGYDAGDMVLHHSRHHRHRDGGIDTGDVIAGILAIGGIAILASAASRDRDEPRSAPRPARYDQPEAAGGGLGHAVDMCVAEAERGGERVESVENAQRDGSGWHVSGTRSGGARFSCTIGNDGRIDHVDDREGYDASFGPIEDRQYSDAVYARLRAGHRDDGAAPAASDYPTDAQPAYPGGPFPGEDGYDDYGARNNAAGFWTPDQRSLE